MNRAKSDTLQSYVMVLANAVDGVAARFSDNPLELVVIYSVLFDFLQRSFHRQLKAMLASQGEVVTSRKRATHRKRGTGGVTGDRRRR